MEKNKIDSKTTAKVIGRSLPISTKQSIEICNWIRGKTSEQGKKLLERVLVKQSAVPYKRHVHGAGHKSGNMASGKYPLKASSHILNLLKSAESNAENNGLSTPLIIEEIISNQASRSWHFGRHRRRKTKSTHISIVLSGAKEKKLKPNAKEKVSAVENKKEETSKKISDKQNQEKKK